MSTTTDSIAQPPVAEDSAATGTGDIAGADASANGSDIPTADLFASDDAPVLGEAASAEAAPVGAKALGPEPRVHPTARISDSTLGRYTEVGERVQMVECELGDYSYVCNDSDLMYATLGKFVSVASHVRVNPSNHPMWRPTLHHFTYRSAQYGFGPDDEGLFDWRREDAVTIGHDVWLGHGVIVLPGVNIGIGAVVGAGAVVTKDVEPYAVMVGVPARKVRDRFEPEVQRELLRIAWWEWGHEEIGRALDDFRGGDIRQFIVKYS